MAKNHQIFEKKLKQGHSSLKVGPEVTRELLEALRSLNHALGCITLLLADISEEIKKLTQT